MELTAWERRPRPKLLHLLGRMAQEESTIFLPLPPLAELPPNAAIRLELVDYSMCRLREHDHFEEPKKWDFPVAPDFPEVVPVRVPVGLPLKARRRSSYYVGSFTPDLMPGNGDGAPPPGVGGGDDDDDDGGWFAPPDPESAPKRQRRAVERDAMIYLEAKFKAQHVRSKITGLPSHNTSFARLIEVVNKRWEDIELNYFLGLHLAGPARLALVDAEGRPHGGRGKALVQLEVPPQTRVYFSSMAVWKALGFDPASQIRQSAEHPEQPYYIENLDFLETLVVRGVQELAPKSYLTIARLSTEQEFADLEDFTTLVSLAGSPVRLSWDTRDAQFALSGQGALEDVTVTVLNQMLALAGDLLSVDTEDNWFRAQIDAEGRLEFEIPQIDLGVRPNEHSDLTAELTYGRHAARVLGLASHHSPLLLSALREPPPLAGAFLRSGEPPDEILDLGGLTYEQMLAYASGLAVHTVNDEILKQESPLEQLKADRREEFDALPKPTWAFEKPPDPILPASPAGSVQKSKEQASARKQALDKARKARVHQEGLDARQKALLRELEEAEAEEEEGGAEAAPVPDPPPGPAQDPEEAAKREEEKALRDERDRERRVEELLDARTGQRQNRQQELDQLRNYQTRIGVLEKKIERGDLTADQRDPLMEELGDLYRLRDNTQDTIDRVEEDLQEIAVRLAAVGYRDPPPPPPPPPAAAVPAPPPIVVGDPAVLAKIAAEGREKTRKSLLYPGADFVEVAAPAGGLELGETHYPAPKAPSVVPRQPDEAAAGDLEEFPTFAAPDPGNEAEVMNAEANPWDTVDAPNPRLRPPRSYLAWTSWPTPTCTPENNAFPDSFYLLCREGIKRDFFGPFGMDSVLAKIRNGRVVPPNNYCLIRNPGRLGGLTLEVVDLGYNRAPLPQPEPGTVPPLGDGLVKMTFVYTVLANEYQLLPFL